MIDELKGRINLFDGRDKKKYSMMSCTRKYIFKDWYILTGVFEHFPRDIFNSVPNLLNNLYENSILYTILYENSILKTTFLSFLFCC